MLSVFAGVHILLKRLAPQPDHLNHRGHLPAALPMPVRRWRLRMFIAEVSELVPKERQHRQPLPRNEEGIEAQQCDHTLIDRTNTTRAALWG